MPDFYKKVSVGLVFLTAFPGSMFAQFRGGNGSGFTFSIAGNQPLGPNIFAGGNDEGLNVSFASNQPLGRNIFIGGNDDGLNVSTASNQPLGRNIYFGGENDGVNVGMAVSQLLGLNIFVGGNDDGIHVASASNQPLGRNIFLGGANDGWAMAFSANLPLPLTLSNFNGQWKSNDALLVWKTSMEHNTAFFELERSFDGVHFTNIHRTNAAGQSSVEKGYQYTDTNIQKLLAAGTTNIYYRLRSVDKNGDATYSGVVILKALVGSTVEYAVFPNPAKDIIIVSSNVFVPATVTYMRLTDANGKVLVLQKMTTNRQQISVSNFAAGMYYLQLVSANKTVYTQKVIIQK